MALEIKDLGVKFYASKTKAEAIALATLPGDDAEPGAICFVSDDTGNYIILNGRIFGDGANGGGSGGGSGSGTGPGGGAVDSVNGKIGAVILELGDFPVVINQDNETLKTLADYFLADGTVISDSFVVYATREDSMGHLIQYEAISISKNGIYIDGKEVSTKEWVEAYVLSQKESFNNDAQQYTDAQIAAITELLLQYADNVVSSAYSYRGTVLNYNALLNLTDLKNGYVYNVIEGNGNPQSDSYIPPGTNYAYIAVEDSTDPKYPGYWDALGGTLNLSLYKTAVLTENEIANALSQAKAYADEKDTPLRTAITANTNAITTIRTNYNTLLGVVNEHTNKITTNTTNINQNKINIDNLATQLTWQ